MPTTIRHRTIPLVTLGLVLGACASAPRPGSDEGGQWRELFDGRSLTGWHGYHAAGAPANWRVVDGTITAVAPGPDLVTDARYADYELALDWKVAPGGNSGVIYRVNDSAGETYETGPEMQILDDARHPDGRSPLTSAGSNFGLYPAPRGAVRPAGEWNSARLWVKGNHVEHWLNGTRVVAYDLGSADWKARVAASKFRSWPGFGQSPTGAIALQDHGDTVSFRNIRIRLLP
jgi:hypothetical protein